MSGGEGHSFANVIDESELISGQSYILVSQTSCYVVGRYIAM